MKLELQHYFLNKKNGVLVNLSSIGGIRGGKFVGSYNSSKSYQITFLESLSISLSKLNKNIQITDVRLGPVKTNMLKGEGFFWVSSVNDTCEKIYKGINKGKRIIYNDSRWRLISNLLRVIPHSLLRL